MLTTDQLKLTNFNVELINHLTYDMYKHPTLKVGRYTTIDSANTLYDLLFKASLEKVNTSYMNEYTKLHIDQYRAVIDLGYPKYIDVATLKLLLSTNNIDKDTKVTLRYYGSNLHALINIKDIDYSKFICEYTHLYICEEELWIVLINYYPKPNELYSYDRYDNHVTTLSKVLTTIPTLSSITFVEDKD